MQQAAALAIEHALPTLLAVPMSDACSRQLRGELHIALAPPSVAPPAMMQPPPTAATATAAPSDASPSSSAAGFSSDPAKLLARASAPPDAAREVAVAVSLAEAVPLAGAPVQLANDVLLQIEEVD